MSNNHPVRSSNPEPSELEALLDEAAQSSLPLAAFARSKGLSYHTLYYARRRRSLGHPIGSRRQRKQDALIPVMLAPDRRSSSGGILLRLPSGLTLEVTADFDEQVLMRLLGVLGPC
jgi:hypothetical protein